jgi:hypothetical protein
MISYRVTDGVVAVFTIYKLRWQYYREQMALIVAGALNDSEQSR